MARIEGIRIKNYRVLKDITLGRLWNTPGVAALTPMTAVIGKNGVGKSSLFDAFGFLADCLKLGVEEACDQRGRGGFDRIRSQGSSAPIEFEVCYREKPGAQLITYILSIDKDYSGRPYVSSEHLLISATDGSDGIAPTFLNAGGWSRCSVERGITRATNRRSVGEGFDFKRLHDLS